MQFYLLNFYLLDPIVLVQEINKQMHLSMFSTGVGCGCAGRIGEFDILFLGISNTIGIDNMSITQGAIKCQCLAIQILGWSDWIIFVSY